MASALASPPPFGASDLKRNARTFLERALVISAIVHLAAVGAFRAAYERNLAREGDDSKRIPGIIDLIPDFVPPMIPQTLINPKSVSPTDGLIVPTKRIDPVDPNVIDYRAISPGNGVGPEPDPGGVGRTDGPGRLPPPQPDPTHAFKVVETPPVPIYAPLPVYPDFAREVGIEGKVIVRVLVGTDGLPKQVVAVSGPKLLFAAAVEGVRRWRFSPGMSGGEPLQVSVEVPVVFTLQGG